MIRNRANLYGATPIGGAYDSGVLFKLSVPEASIEIAHGENCCPPRIGTDKSADVQQFEALIHSSLASVVSSLASVVARFLSRIPEGAGQLKI